MNTKNKNLLRCLIGLTLVLLLGSNFWTVAQASPPAQDTRPPIDDGDDGGGGGGGLGGDSNGGGGSGAGGQVGCASIIGQVINWGLGPQGSVETELKTGSWRTATASASDGSYGFGGLGVGLATLHVAISPEDSRQPLIQDAGVYLNCNYLTIANVALYSGERVDPPATIEMSAPKQAIIPGRNFEISLTIKNSLPNDISNVIVTDMMPPGFTALKVSSSVDPKDAQIINGGADGQLVAINLDKLDAGATATIRITVNADVDLAAGTKIRNAATLFYRESAADQDGLIFTVGGDELPIPAASAAQEAGAEFVPPAGPTTGGGGAGDRVSAVTEASTGPAKEITGGDETVPPGNMPSTGGDLLSLLDPVEEAGLARLDDVPTVGGAAAKPMPGSSMTAADELPVKVIASDKESAGVPPVTVAVATLFLGLLALGSGLTYLTRRS